MFRVDGHNAAVLFIYFMVDNVYVRMFVFFF